ncbi:DHA2 family multidrug resistance protein-like MFS transporter [Amycolatopsis lexingtonensis]|uniref:DHA2 family multidrug resistance protein-like MFS transporter n=1 Tax=Amycolatopsis lexingtonensis TaxID=218822 RepID=A0ABR9IG12_9PSEU|nr:MFS transporter [Amycolatopsis lexingtonensis]MBE1502131.1 DHA2 family multidrug resistance protein-like MFS transporter [Amycolatopsis lexingtonensis]
MTTNSSTPPGELAGKKEWIGLAVLILPTLLLSLDLSVLILAIPHVTADLHPSSAQMLWIVDIYGFTIAGLLVTMGNLGDRIGHRKLLMIGAALFSVASAVAAWSSSAEMLIAARAGLGIAGSTLMPTMLGLISTMFRNAKQRAVAISVQTSFFMVGMAIGPLVGGVMLSAFWWGSVFLLGLPVMGLLLVVAPILLPEHKAAGAGGFKLDLVSIVLSMATILPVIYGLKELARGSSVVVSLVVLAAGLLFGVAFVRRQRRLADPLLDVRLLGRPAFSGALGMMLLGGSTISGIILLFNQYLQLVLGLSPLNSGLWLIPYTVGMVAGYMVSPGLAQRFRPAVVIAAGMMVSLVGFVLLTQVPASGGLVITVLGTVLATAGLSPMLVLGIGLVMGSAPPEKAGAAGAISQTSNELGVAFGIAVFGSIATAVYRGVAEVPAGVPADVAAAAREGIAEGTAAAGTLPGDLAGSLLTAIREAFTSGFAGAAIVCAVLMVVLAAVALLLFRHVPKSGQEPAPAAESIPDEVPAGETV